MVLVNDEHPQFSSTKAVANLIRQYEDKGLSVHVFCEFENQAAKYKESSFRDVENFAAEEIKSEQNFVDDHATHVLAGRREFRQKKCEEFIASGKSIREIAQQQLDHGEIVDRGNRELLEYDLKHGTYGKESVSSIRNDMKKHNAPEEAIEYLRKSVAVNSSGQEIFNYDAKGEAARPLLEGFMIGPLSQAKLHQELALEQITAAKQQRSYDVEIIMFGNSHLANIRDSLVQNGIYKSDKIRALTSYERAQEESYSQHPFQKEGIVSTYNNNGEIIGKEILAQSSSNDNIQTTNQKWSERFSSKSGEAEDLIPQKKSWKDVLEATNKSKDDSTITR